MFLSKFYIQEMLSHTSRCVVEGVPKLRQECQTTKHPTSSLTFSKKYIYSVSFFYVSPLYWRMYEDQRRRIASRSDKHSNLPLFRLAEFTSPKSVCKDRNRKLTIMTYITSDLDNSIIYK